MAGLFTSGRVLYFYFTVGGEGHVQSLLMAAVLLIVGFQVMLMGLLADVISGNRKLLEDLLYRARVSDASQGREGQFASGAPIWSRRAPGSQARVP
jgi:hypothetical protein